MPRLRTGRGRRGRDHDGHQRRRARRPRPARRRGVRLNTDNKGGMPIETSQIGEFDARIAPFGWHIEWLFPGKDIIELMPAFTSVRRCRYRSATSPTSLRRRGCGPGIPGADRADASREHLDKDFRRQPRQRTDLPPYDDVKPMAQRLSRPRPSGSCGGPTGRTPTSTSPIPTTAIWLTPSVTG